MAAALFISLLALPLVAADSDRQEGIRAFQAGDLHGAREAFERAMERTESPSASLRYNLGVVYYQLEQYDQSREQFTALLKDTDTAGIAYYNLGLIELADGTETAAAREFERAYLLAMDDKIRRLASKQLRRLDIDFTDSELPLATQSWQAVIGLFAGYDDNPTLVEGDDASEDAFVEALAAISGYALGDPTNGLRLTASGVSRQYDDERDQSASALSLAAAWDVQWRALQQSFQLSQDWLFDREREAKRRSSLESRTRYPLGPGQTEFSLVYRHIEADGRFSQLNGYQIQSAVGYTWITGNHRIQGRYRVTRDDRDDFEDDFFFISESAIRQEALLQWRFQVATRFALISDLEFRDSRYDDRNRVFDNEGSRRHDRRWRGRLEGRYQVNRNLMIRARAEHLDNHSNTGSELIDRNYRRNQFTIGLLGTF